ncbi:MAG: MiaB/RimO family radical SAM methylthiotransferase [Candidatus Omnitrophica bacterium]|nr:MiaB/RimO family radical SAM methylthiotransferase [Candidatus Omnitrophota bacterium]
MVNKLITRNKFSLCTYGCQMNVRDSEVICGLLKTRGYRIVAEPDQADVVIFNTCSVRQHAEDKVWSEIGNIAKKAKRKEHAGKQAPVRRVSGNAKAGTVPIVGLVGCMAQNYKESVFERSEYVDFVVGPSDIAKIPEIIETLFQGQASVRRVSGNAKAGTAPVSHGLYDRKIWETDGQVRPEEIYHTGFYEDKEHAYVVISEGCSNYCSYCIVPYVRGRLHNRGHRDILKEIHQAVDKGISRITLLGQNVNAYEHGDVDFIGLINEVNRIKGLKEFSFVTSHPRDTSARLFKAMADCDKLKKYLHLPVQSGSDKLLERMNRGYTSKFYLGLVDDYRKIIKDGLLSTDIIVGFSSETEGDFKATYNLMEDVGFDSAYIFKYSPRPQSEAFGWADDVDKTEKERRHKLILDLQRKISKGRNAKK